MSSEKNKVLLEAINETLGTETQQIVEKYGELTLEINRDKILSVMRVLKEADQFLFTQLTDISVVDYLTYGQADWQTQKASSQGPTRRRWTQQKDRIHTRTRTAGRLPRSVLQR